MCFSLLCAVAKTPRWCAFACLRRECPPRWTGAQRMTHPGLLPPLRRRFSGHQRKRRAAQALVRLPQKQGQEN